MASLGEVKRQLSDLMSVIKAQNFKFEDVMPREMQDHFQDMAALREARAYIKELESKEKMLEAANASLRSEVQEKQAEIGNQPGNYKAMQVDIQQSERRVDYYKELVEHEQIRANTFERKLLEANKLQSVLNEDARKIRRLEQTVADCQASGFQLVEENRRLTEQYKAQHEETLKLIKEKDDTVSTLRNYAHKLEAEKQQVDEDSEHNAETLNSIIDTLEEQTHSATDMANCKTVLFYNQRAFNDQVYSSLVSEIAPLHCFYEHVIDILGVYQSVIKDLSNPNSCTMNDVPPSLDSMLKSANDQLYAYQQVSAHLRTGADLQEYGQAQQAVVSQVDGIADVAARLYTNLGTFKADLIGLSRRLRNEPDCEGKNGSGFSTPTQASASSRSSVLSFVSFAKRSSTRFR